MECSYTAHFSPNVYIRVDEGDIYLTVSADNRPSFIHKTSGTKRGNSVSMEDDLYDHSPVCPPTGTHDSRTYRVRQSLTSSGGAVDIKIRDLTLAQLNLAHRELKSIRPDDSYTHHVNFHTYHDLYRRFHRIPVGESAPDTTRTRDFVDFPLGVEIEIAPNQICIVTRRVPRFYSEADCEVQVPNDEDFPDYGLTVPSRVDSKSRYRILDSDASAVRIGGLSVIELLRIYAERNNVSDFGTRTLTVTEELMRELQSPSKPEGGRIAYEWIVGPSIVAAAVSFVFNIIWRSRDSSSS